MAVTVMDDADFSYRLVNDADSETAVVQDVVNGSTTLYSVVIDNTGNAGTEAHPKLYDSLPDGGVVAGTTAPDLIFMALRATKATYTIPGGFSFTTGLSYRCVTEAGTAGTTNPGAAVLVDFVVK